MIKCEVINQNVTIHDFKRLQNIKRLKSNDKIEKFNYFEIGDTFETDSEYAIYLSGELEEQPIQTIRILEIIPEETKNKYKIDKKK